MLLTPLTCFVPTFVGSQGNPLSRGETVGVVILANVGILICCLAYGMRLRFQALQYFRHPQPKEEVTGYTGTPNDVNPNLEPDAEIIESRAPGESSASDSHSVGLEDQRTAESTSVHLRDLNSS